MALFAVTRKEAHFNTTQYLYIGLYLCLPDVRELVGKLLSSLSASSLEYLSSVSGFHSLSETMLNLSLTLLRLVSSKH